jgi:hypothetical protein
VGNYEHLKTEHAGSASNWLDQIKPPVLDGEFARNLSPLYFQSPQCQAISRPPNVVRRSDHHVFVGRPDDTDRTGDELSVTDAALSRCVCEVFHGLECTNKNTCRPLGRGRFAVSAFVFCLRPALPARGFWSFQDPAMIGRGNKGIQIALFRGNKGSHNSLFTRKSAIPPFTYLTAGPHNLIGCRPGANGLNEL